MFNSYFIKRLWAMLWPLLFHHRDMVVNPVTLSFGEQLASRVGSSTRSLALSPPSRAGSLFLPLSSFHEENASIIQQLLLGMQP